jgi:hypothetical protein
MTTCPWCGVSVRSTEKLEEHMRDKCPLRSANTKQRKRVLKQRGTRAVRQERARKQRERKRLELAQRRKVAEQQRLIAARKRREEERRRFARGVRQSWKWSTGTMSGTNSRHKCRYVVPKVHY